MSTPHLKESHIHKAVVAHWRACGRPGTLVATIPNMGAMGQHGLTKGLPDLLVIGPGVHAYVELKTETRKLTQPQRDFQDLCEKNGILFAVTHGRDEPIKLLERWGIVRSTSDFVSIGDAAASVVNDLARRVGR
jgi:hypothetical protein